jgi:hypothetical protein
LTPAGDAAGHGRSSTRGHTRRTRRSWLEPPDREGIVYRGAMLEGSSSVTAGSRSFLSIIDSDVEFSSDRLW